MFDVITEYFGAHGAIDQIEHRVEASVLVAHLENMKFETGDRVNQFYVIPV